MSRHKDSSGQAFVLTIMFLLVLMGMATAVLDVGSWYRAHRALQATVDAAALAGAQALPEDSGEASALANEYATKNGGGSMTITFSEEVFPDDTINVEGTRPAPGFFAKVFGVDSITVRTHAKARAGFPVQAKYVVPIVVDEKHEKLKCNPNPCAGLTELKYQHLKKNGSPDGAGNFGFINLTGDNGVGTSDLENWITNGFDKYLGLGDYDARTGNPFSSSHIKDTLDARVGDIMLFPIYRKLSGSGTNAKYEIIGWAGFRLTGVDVKGNDEKLFGEFVSVTWDGIQASTASAAPPNFGVKNVSLID
jgi:putative Flp pilus-assembly TadE/G-like protein